MVNKNSDFDSLLKNRAIPDPSSNLSERIIEASLCGEKTSYQFGWYERMVNFWAIPKPALAFACFALLALAITWPQLNTSKQGAENYSAQEDFASVLEYDFIYEAFDISSI